MTPSLDTGCRVGGVTVSLVSEHPGFGSDSPIGSGRRKGAPVSGIRASRIWFEPANRVGSKKRCYSVVVSEPRFTRLWKSLGLGGSGIEYMIENMCLVMCWPDVDVLVFCIDGSSSEFN